MNIYIGEPGRIGPDREPIPISLVAHQVFCPRRAWLEAMGESTDTYQMSVGTQAHRASDDPSASRPRVLRSVDVSSQSLGVVGRCDEVELHDDGTATLVEHKATPVRRRAEVTLPQIVQLALQTQALRESGVSVTAAAVYFTEHGVRLPVPVGPEQIDQARTHVTETVALLKSKKAPSPLEDDKRCNGCSHVGVCLPDERQLGPVRRRIQVNDPDAQVLHLSTPGSRAHVRSGRIRVIKGDEKLGSVPIERVWGVVAHGNVDLSGGLIRELLWRSIVVVWCSSSGRVVGWASSARRPNGGPRVHQHVASSQGHLGLARSFITAKICNQATLLRRHGNAPDEIRRLRELQRRVGESGSLPELFGIEGDAAARYFSAFSTMLSPRVVATENLEFVSRTRRPAKDPVNAALNFTYGLLLADAVRAVVACGLDPHAGFLHSSERNKPALALDLAEEFRAPVADSVVIGAFNNGELKGRDFTRVTGSTNLKPTGRSALIAAYERRAERQFTHPLFNYKVSWRRAMEIQARLVLGVVDGTQPDYRGIMIR